MHSSVGARQSLSQETNGKQKCIRHNVSREFRALRGRFLIEKHPFNLNLHGE